MTFEQTSNFLIANLNNVRVGIIRFWKDDNLIVVDDVYVYPGYRHNGYGKQLVEEFHKQSAKQKYQVISNCWYYNFVVEYLV